jgi:hypothetical protein
MPWARLDDRIDENPKVLSVSIEARWLYVCGLTYAARTLSDGLVPAAALPRIAGDVPRVERRAAELEQVGLWERLPSGWQIHDWRVYNPPAEKVKEERERARERMQRVRSRVRGSRSRGVRANEPRTTPRSSVVPSSQESSSAPQAAWEPQDAPAREEQPFELSPELHGTWADLPSDLQGLLAGLQRQEPAFVLSGNVVRNEISKHGSAVVVETLQALRLGNLAEIEYPNAYFRQAVADHRKQAQNGSEKDPESPPVHPDVETEKGVH